MADEPVRDHADAAVPLAHYERHAQRQAPPAAVVQAARESLRTTDAYIRLVLDRIELASTSDVADLGRISATALARLTATSDALQRDADRMLGQLSPRVAHSARMIAALARDALSVSPDGL